jgi:hypothetical protein
MRIEFLTCGAAGSGMESGFFVDRSLGGGRPASIAFAGAVFGKVV